MHSTQLRMLIERLEGVRKSGQGYVAQCPAHEDRTPSLSITDGHDRVLIHCFAGCEVAKILESIGLTYDDLRFDVISESQTPAAYKLFGSSRRHHGPPATSPRHKKKPQTEPPISRLLVARFRYEDEHGNALFEVRRYEPKAFFQYRYEGGRFVSGLGNTRRVIYALPLVHSVASKGGIVMVVEGEKQADALNAGLSEAACATTSPGGAEKWQDIYAASLLGASQVFVLPDNDAPGERHAQMVAASVRTLGLSTEIVRLPGLPPKGDVIDYLALGHTPQDVLKLCLQA